MDLIFLIAYLVILTAGYWRSKSLAWFVIMLAGSAGIFGAFINFAIDRGHHFTRIELQWILLLALGSVLAATWIRTFTLGRSREIGYGLLAGYGWRRQLIGIGLPAGAMFLFFVLVTTFLTKDAAFTHPVSFLIGHGVAEDNSKWLDFTSQFASGQGITQPVPMGGPLELMLTFIGTAIGVVSQVVLGGYNQVAVAANTVVMGEFFLVALMPLAFAPMLEAKFGRSRLPVPFIWIGAAVLSVGALAAINFGHLTLQFTFLVTGLWAATFLSGSKVPRARLITSLAAAASMTVWVPLNVVAIVIVAGWIGVYASRLVRMGSSAVDWIGAALLLVVTIGVAQPVWSSVYYLLIGSAESTSMPAAGISGGVSASVHTGIADSTLFAASGGTEQTGPILAVLSVAVVFIAGLSLAPIAGPLRSSLYRRFVPIAVMAFFAVAITSLDFWYTGSGPHYGSMKFTFLVAIFSLATALPIALRLIDPSALTRMTASRWMAIAGVIILLMLDTLLPRAIALTRPEQWSPPIPFNNSTGSYWYPADVNGSGRQSIASNPVACVYLPNGAKAPSAIVPSGLSDPQRVYACTRQLAGLSASDAGAQPIVDWLRREWFTNTPAWSDVYDSLAAMPKDVLVKPVILLDEGSNVIGLDSMESLLQRFPRTVG